MNQVVYKIIVTRGRRHIAQAIQDGKVIAISKQSYTNGEEAMIDVQGVVVEKNLGQYLAGGDRIRSGAGEEKGSKTP